MPARCERCRRPIWVWPWQRRLCREPEMDACIAISRVIEVEEGLVSDPAPIMFDPPPEDIEVCSLCKGRGEAVLLRIDWEMGPVIGTCPRCAGSEVDPSCLG